jgi:hypothetical protein
MTEVSAAGRVDFREGLEFLDTRRQRLVTLWLPLGIIMLVLYRVSQGRANTLVDEMEEDAMGLVNLLESARRSARDSAPATESA